MRQRQASRCVMQAAAVGAHPRGGARAERAASARQKFSVHSALPPVVRNARHDRKRGAGKLPSGSWGARARVRRAVRAVPCGLCSAVLRVLCSALLCWLCSAVLCCAVAGRTQRVARGCIETAAHLRQRHHATTPPPLLRRRA
eukprot:COSAG01_NODE_470_length_16575_cov_5.572408_6_plen_143_part_00